MFLYVGMRETGQIFLAGNIRTFYVLVPRLLSDQITIAHVWPLVNAAIIPTALVNYVIGINTLPGKLTIVS